MAPAPIRVTFCKLGDDRPSVCGILYPFLPSGSLADHIEKKNELGSRNLWLQPPLRPLLLGNCQEMFLMPILMASLAGDLAFLWDKSAEGGFCQSAIEAGLRILESCVEAKSASEIKASADNPGCLNATSVASADRPVYSPSTSKTNDPLDYALSTDLQSQLVSVLRTARTSSEKAIPLVKNILENGHPIFRKIL
ncbi:hypothetical protein MBM_03809 [Drepanopeziza brunnea f. sp. 'multigermtubi' MB_m1]|uniref:Uncharacterized protein n=1 Tax=Marssonina brunnea f. sp. multigermtubi (strain MB_m1) TaxID=1072389 RepID=K1WZG5_MARBU|nr:uncharacterized protein MBM_03809 [Drepanopeziza brunnea f. sp. 'multigermtubi' MB_m1]EKD18037.1 hypothetical protein MBM_03809 [Drepanopeziza brunnea f. sp. 'multigermtubi' MB_m1]